MAERGRLGVLISGRGSNMVALLDAIDRGRIRADAAVVLSNVPDAAGLSVARSRGVPVEIVDHRKIKPRRQHEAQVIEALRSHQVDLVCLAGYMRLLTPQMVSAFPDRIMNVHPSLLPAFPGLHAQRQALDYGVRFSGCTVHFVDEQCDHGPIITQATVPVLDDDDEDSLSSRILEQEHEIYAEAVAMFFDGRLEIAGRKVRVRSAASR